MEAPVKIEDWIRIETNECIFQVTCVYDDGTYDAEGLDYEGNWSNDSEFGYIKTLKADYVRLATVEEIDFALSKKPGRAIE